MKRMFVALLLIMFSGDILAQFPSKDPVPRWFGMVRIDSLLWIDTKDTLGVIPRTGTLIMRRQLGDTGLYVGNGYKFVKVGSDVKALDSAYRSHDTLYFPTTTGGLIAVKMAGIPQANIVGLSDSLLNKPTVAAADLRYKPITYVPSWSEVTGKPTTFPPSAHTHVAADVTNFTSAARGTISATAPITYNSSTGAIGWNGTTSNVPEGMNLYFSNARVQSFSDTRYAPLTRLLSVGTGMTGGGDLSVDRSIGLDWGYLDDRYLSGYKQRDAVRVATTANITLSGLQAIDGVTVAAGDRVLVKNQTAGAQNGIYIAGTGTWSRSPDFDAVSVDEVAQGSQIFVSEGTVNNKTGWSLATGGNIILNTTPLTFIQYSGANSYSAGTGLTLTGNTFSAQTGSNLWNANKLQNIGIATTAPTTGQLLRYDGTNWSPWTSNYLTGELDLIAQSKTVSLSAGTGINITGSTQTIGNNPAFTITNIGSLSTTLANGTTANNNISLGAIGNATSYSYNILRNVGGTDYTATFGNTKGASMTSTDGSSTKVFLVAADRNAPQYSPDAGSNYYDVWHANNHPAGSAFSPTLTGANVLSSLTTNSAGHVTGITTRTLTAGDIGAASSNINLSTVLTNGNQANNSITIGAVGNTSPFNYTVIRNNASTNYTTTYGNFKGAAIGSTDGTNSRSFLLSTDKTAPEYSPNGGATVYTIWHENNHPSGTNATTTFTGANVPSVITTNTSGHLTSITTRALTPSDIGAAPASGSANYIQNQTTSAQPGSGFWTAGVGVANRFASVGTVATTTGDLGLYEGTSAASANQRWRIIRTGTEGSGNTGNDFNIQSLTNTGVLWANPFSINRSTSIVTMAGGFRAANTSGIFGTGTGSSNVSYLAFYESDGSTRVGYVGKSSNTNNDLSVGSDKGNINLIPSTPSGVVTVIGNASITGNTSVGSGLNVTGNAGIGGNATINGTGTASQLMADYGSGLGRTRVRMSGSSSGQGFIYNEVNSGSGFATSGTLNIQAGQVNINTGTNISGGLGVTGDASISGSTSVGSWLNVTGNAGIGGNATVDGELLVGGSISGTPRPHKLNLYTGTGSTSGNIAWYNNAGVQASAITMNDDGSVNFTGSKVIINPTLQVAGGISIKEGQPNSKMGVVTFASGVTSVVVNTTAVAADSRIFLTIQSGSMSATSQVSAPLIGPKIPGSSFTIIWAKDVPSSTGTVAWEIKDPF